MRIGEISAATGISERMVRHYESTGLIRAPARGAGGYRDYGDADLHRLRFVAAARAVPLAFDDIRELLDLWDDEARPPGEVAAAARECAGRLAARGEALAKVHAALIALAEQSTNGGRAGHPLVPGPGGAGGDPERDFAIP